jgi:hypothetical protein
MAVTLAVKDFQNMDLRLPAARNRHETHEQLAVCESVQLGFQLLP